MCYVRLSKDVVDSSGGLKDADWWLEMAKQACDCGLLYPLLTGGEPFLREDLEQIYFGMVKLGLQVSINTNGTLIGEEQVKWLSESKPTRINLTLYGTSGETYEKLCGNGEAYSQVMRSVELLRSNHIPLKFNTSITPYNEEDLESLIAYAEKVNVPLQVATYMFPPVRRDEKSFGKNFRLSPERAGYLRARADFLQSDPERFASLAESFGQFVYPTEQVLKGAGDGSADESMRMTCRAGRCSCWIDWQGYMTNCGMQPRIRTDLREHSFSEAWRIICDETEKVSYSPVCCKCPNKQLCHSCIAMIYNECGGFTGRPDYICKMNQSAAVSYREMNDESKRRGTEKNQT